jgi:hypothetical protein
MFSKFSKYLLCILSAAALTACGGGGDDDSSSAADKYVGTWVSTCMLDADTNVSARFITKITKQSASVIDMAVKVQGFTSTNCSGSVAYEDSSLSSTITLTGTKKIGSKTVDTAIGNNDFGQDIMLREENTLYFGDSDVAADAAGYPTAIDYSNYMTKQ